FVPPNLVFVLDKSGSMFGSIIDFGGGITKSFWQVLHETLEAVITEREDQIRFGTNWFPSIHAASGGSVTYPAQACGVDAGLQVEPALNAWSDFENALPAANATGSLSMVTPAQGGYDAAAAWI